MKKLFGFLLTVVFITIFTVSCFAAGQILLNPKFQAFDENGDPLVGGLVYTYENGTTTDKATYTTVTLGVANANPVVLDTRGEADIHLSGIYTIVLTTSVGGAIWTLDNVEGQGSTIIDFVQLSDYADLAAAILSIGGTETTLWIDTDDTLGANAIIPVTLDIIGLNGHSITTTGFTFTSNGTCKASEDLFAGTGTVAINGPFEAGLYRVFNGAAMTVTFGGGVISEIHPYWFENNTTPGTTDMTTAIQAAYNAIKTIGGAVVLPAETCKTTATLTFDDNASVIGSGENSIIQPSAAVATAINFDPVTNALAGFFHPIKLANFYIDGTNTTGSTGVIVGSGATSVASAVLEDMTITSFGGAGGHGLKVRNSVSFTSRNSIYTKSARNVLFSGAVASVPTTSYFLGGAVFSSTIDEGMLIESSVQALFERVIFEDNKQEGLVIAPTTTYNAYLIRLDTCWFEGNYEDTGTEYSMVIDGTVAGVTAEVHLENVFFNVSGTSEKALDINKGNSVTLSNVVIGAGLVDGINIQNASTRVLVLDSTPRHDWATIINYNETEASVAFVFEDNTNNVLEIDSTTPCVGYGNWYVTANTGATLISFLDNGYPGQHVKIRINDATTTFDFTGTNMYGNAGVDWTGAAEDWIECVHEGTNWYCAVHDCTP